MSVCEHLLSYVFNDNEDGVGVPDLAGEFEPRLAESWSFSDDGKTITFNLRQGVQSEFGNELTAEDIVWSYQRSFEVEGTGQWMFNSAGVTGKDGIRAADEHTLEIDLTQPSELFLHNQAMPLNSPCIFDTTEVKKHATEEDPWAEDWLGTHSATFGPYRVTEFSPGQQVVLEVNPNYYRDPPRIAKIIYREVPESATRLQLLLSGDVQVAKDLDARERQQLEGAEGVQVINYVGNEGVIYGLNSEHPPLDNPLVRQAIAYAAPIDDIIATVYLGDPTVRLLTGYTPENYPSHVDYWPYYPTDLDRARALLDEAGQGPFTLKVTFNANRQDHEQVAVLLQTQLAKIGIDVVVDKLQPAQFQEVFFGRTAESVLVQDAAWNADPGYGLSLYFSRGEMSHANWINYRSDPAQTKIEEVVATLDPTARFELGRQAYEAVVDDAPWAFMIGTGFHLAMRDNVAGLNWRTNNLIDFADLYYTD